MAPADQAAAARSVWRGFFALPDVGRQNGTEGINGTFSLLVRAMVIFGVLLALWSIGASVLQAAWLVGWQGRVGGATVPAASVPTLQFVGLLLPEIARGIGGVSVICMTSGLVGAILGFLFGIPRPISAAEAPPAGAGGPPSVPGLNRRKIWESSTNLTQLSDWLTKVIVGVSLVEARRGWELLQKIATTAAAVLFGMRHGSVAVLSAAILGGGVFGFLFCYLYTDLIVARLIAAADRTLGDVPDQAVRQIEDIGAEAAVLGPRIARVRLEGESPSIEQIDAALQLSNIRPDTLDRRHDLKMWARARSVLNDYKAASDGYMRLIAMPEDGSAPTDPGLLIEAARVLYADGRRTYAASLAELALHKLEAASSIAAVPAGVRLAVVGDCMSLRLAGLGSGGAPAVLDTMARFIKVDPHLQDDPRLRLLRALAHGQLLRDGLPAARPVPLPDDVAQDLVFAVRRGTPIETIMAFTETRDPPPQAPERRDDLAVFGRDRIRALLTSTVS